MRKAVAASLMLMLMAGAVLGAGLHRSVEVDASGHSATRAFASPSVEPGGTLEVTIVARGFGAFAQVAETLPEGFRFIGSSLPDSAVESAASTVTFTLLGVERFSYTVEAPRVAAVYRFTGIILDQTKDRETIGGDDTIHVGTLPTPTSTPVPTETPIPTATPVPTETPQPTSTPESTQTPESTPTPEATPTAEPVTTPTPEPTAPPTLIPTPIVAEPPPDSEGGMPLWLLAVLSGLVVAIFAGFFALLRHFRRLSPP